MTINENTIHKFYEAFATSDFAKIQQLYHPNVQFTDPVFGMLNGDEVLDMWKMLLEKSKGNLKINYSDISANEHLGSAKWTANYRISSKNRAVVNKIESKFHFKEGLIIKQTDDFDIWKWSKQALGLKGFLLGWTGFMQRKITKNARISLKKYYNK